MEALIVILIATAAVAAVLLPLVWPGADRAPSQQQTELEREIRAYRDALRAGTLCERCGRANAEGSRFCMECGARLKPRGAARAGDERDASRDAEGADQQGSVQQQPGERSDS